MTSSGKKLVFSYSQPTYKFCHLLSYSPYMNYFLNASQLIVHIRTVIEFISECILNQYIDSPVQKIFKLKVTSIRKLIYRCSIDFLSIFHVSIISASGLS
jgi:hypothetical protein